MAKITSRFLREGRQLPTELEEARLEIKEICESYDLDFFDTTDAKVKAEVLASVEFAENSPFPALEEIYDDVYTQKDYPFIA